MTPQRKQLERLLLKFWVGQTSEYRGELCRQIGIEYGQLLAVIQSAWQEEKTKPHEDVRRKRLTQIRASIRAPRFGKIGKQFMLRHYPEALALMQDGANLREISAYLAKFHRFKISPSYLKRVMEAAAL